MKHGDPIKDLMQQFKKDEDDDKNFAVAYIDFMSQHGHEVISYLKNVPRHKRNLTLINDADSLGKIGQRLALISDLFVFGETSSKAREYFRDDPQDYNTALQDMNWGRVVGSDEWEPYFDINTRHIYTSDLESLQGWLKYMSKFIKSGNAVYLPRIETRKELVTSYAPPPTVNLIDPIFDKANYLVQSDPAIQMESAQLAPIFHLEIPSIDLVDGKTLYRICEDERDSLGRLRDTLVIAFKEAEEAWGSEHYDGKIDKIQRTIINEGLRQIRSDMKALRTKNVIQAVGAAIGYTTLTVSIVLGMDPLIQILGPAGISAYFAKQIADYMDEVKKIRERPMYFLWRLEEKSR